MKTLTIPRLKCLAWTLPLLGLGLSSCGKKNEFAPPPPTPVGVQSPVVRQQIVYHEFPGHLEAMETVELRARVKGILDTVSPDFRPGRRISKGTLVFQIDDATYKAALEAAEANHAKTIADLEIAQITLQRRLTAQEAISKIQIDAARADVKAAEAMVKSAEAAVAEANETLSWCKISAPISGRISELQVDQFNLVGNNEATLLATIVQDDSLRVYFDINERTSLQFLRERKTLNKKDSPSSIVTLTLADGTAYEHPAVIDYADNKLDTDTGTIRVRAIVPNPDEKLADRLYVKVKVPGPTPDKESILIPSVAIQQDLGGHFALVVDSNNLVVRKNLTLGNQVDRLRIVKEGLSGDEKIVVQGLQRIREGATVMPTEVPREEKTPGAPSPANKPSKPTPKA